jgi:hypothetical protein
MLTKIKAFAAKFAAPARKAIVGFLAPIVLVFLHSRGISVDNTVVDTAIAGLVTALIVWVVPNAKPVLDAADAAGAK